MSKRRVLALGLGALLAACSSDSSVKPLPDDSPYSSLSASQIYVEKGVKYMDAGNYDVALKDMKRAIDLDDDNSEAYNAIAVLYERIDQYPNAEANFKKALSVKPDNYGAHNNYGRFLCNRGRPVEAFQEFQKIIGNKLYDQPWVALTNAGICARGAGKRGEAEDYLRQALEVAPNFPPALLEMAKLSRENGQNLSARAFLQRYFAAAGPSPSSLLLAIEIETSLGNSDVAQEYAQALRSQFGGSKEASEARRRLGE
jgi:type IV pilus assembly protein PilF